MKEVTKDDYILTNINPYCYYVIRLKDDKEYIVYWIKENGKKVNYIKKDGEEIPLSKEVLDMHLSAIREYERDGI